MLTVVLLINSHIIVLIHFEILCVMSLYGRYWQRLVNSYLIARIVLFGAFIFPFAIVDFLTNVEIWLMSWMLDVLQKISISYINFWLLRKS